MQFPSIQHIIRKSTVSLKRFPAVLLAAAVAVFFGVYLADQPQQETQFVFNIILVAILGIPLFTVITITGEHKEWFWTQTGIMLLAGFLLLVAYFFTLPDDLDTAPYKHVYRYILYLLAVHLLAAIGPYMRSDQIHAFWQYNKTLFLRFLTSVFFSAVLFVGLAVALGSIQVLLDVDIDGVRYFQLFLIIAGLFNTWFFLAGIPNPQAFAAINTYPKGIKIFTQNILIPLVVIYLAILYIYTGKIILQWAWPEGWVAYLVLSFSIVGILALLLLFPVREKAENRWIKTFSSGFFIALVPLVILLLLAILRRIWEYAFTIERYFVLILGLWLAGIVIYFLTRKKQNIKVIPASLCVLAFLVSFGPWGAFSVSERSQINRLQAYLQQNDILDEGMIQPTSDEVPFDDRREISSIIRYLNNNHGLDGIQPWFSQDLDSLTTETEADSVRPVSHYNRPEYVLELMEVEYVRPYQTSPASLSASTHLLAAQGDVLNTEGVRTVVQDLNWSTEENPQEYAIDSDRSLFVKSDSTGMNIYISPDSLHTVRIDLEEIIQQHSDVKGTERNNLPRQTLTYDYKSDSLGIRVYFSRISWRDEDGRRLIHNIHFDIGIR